MRRSKKRAYIQYNEDGTGGMELFDMVNDPKQFNNLADNPKYVEVVNRFKKKPKDKLTEVRDNDLNKVYKK